MTLFNPALSVQPTLGSWRWKSHSERWQLNSFLQDLSNASKYCKLVDILFSLPQFVGIFWGISLLVFTHVLTGTCLPLPFIKGKSPYLGILALGKELPYWKSPYCLEQISHHQCHTSKDQVCKSEQRDCRHPQPGPSALQILVGSRGNGRCWQHAFFSQFVIAGSWTGPASHQCHQCQHFKITRHRGSGGRGRSARVTGGGCWGQEKEGDAREERGDRKVKKRWGSKKGAGTKEEWGGGNKKKEEWGEEGRRPGRWVVAARNCNGGGKKKREREGRVKRTERLVEGQALTFL